MQTVETNHCVFSTTDYDSIKTIAGNRMVNPNHVEVLKDSMLEKQLKIPAVLNEKMEIIDGQHRWDACKALKLPFYYIIVEGYDLKDVQRMNTNMKNWTTNDFMQTYLDLYKLGNSEYEDYARLSNFITKYGITLEAAITITNFAIKDGIKQNSFRTGNLFFKSKEENTASLFIMEVKEIFEGLHEKKWCQSAFLKTYAEFYFCPEYDSSIMIKRQGILSTGSNTSNGSSLPFKDLSGAPSIRNGLIVAYNHSLPRARKLSTENVKYIITDMQKGA